MSRTFAPIDQMLLMERGPDRIEQLLTKRNARWVLGIIAVFSLVFGYALKDVRLDYDFEKFFPLDDPELDRYTAFKERFGGDSDYLLLALENAPTVFDLDFLVRADSLTARLARVPHITSITSPTRARDVRITPVGVFQVPWLRITADSLLAADSTRIWSDPAVREGFFSADAKALLIYLLAEPGLSKVKSDTVLAGVQRAIASSGLDGVRVSGRIFGQAGYIKKMEKEIVVFFSASVALLAVFLFFAFRSKWGVAVPIAVVGLTVLWQVGIMTLLGLPLSILTMLLPTILFVVGMSDTVHILEGYIDGLRAGRSRTNALATTYREVGLPTFLTALTSAIGFATLGSASIVPLREFGIYTALGVLLAFTLAFTLLPALLVSVGPEKMLPRANTPNVWDRNLPTLFRFVLRRRKAILIVFAGLCVVAAFGVSRLKVNNFLLEDIPENDPMKENFHFFEDHFGGVRPFDLQVELVDTTRSITDLDVLQQMERVEHYLKSDYGVGHVVSPLTVMRGLNKASNGGSADFNKLPDEADEARRLWRKAQAFGGKELMRTLVSADGRSARLSGRMRDEGGIVHKVKNKKLDAFIVANTDSALVRFHQTGMAFLIDRNNERLSGQLMRGMGAAVLLTALIMLWFFRSLRMVLVALLPNVVPLLFIAGVMGALGIDLKVSTAIIFSIAFGIAEDDTIHMLARLRHEMRNGLSPAYALKRTYLSTGKAVSVTSVMLISGFLTLLLSDFASVYYMGLLVTLTLFFAAVTELLLMPVLVLLIVRRSPFKKRAVLPSVRS